MANYDYSSPNVSNCTFRANAANRGGGMRNAFDTSPIVANCTFSSNLARYYGGGIDNISSSPILEGCTFSGNSADYGGGIFNVTSDPTVKGCSFSGNSASAGGGVYNGWDSDSSLNNCIFWRDMPEEIYFYSSIPVITYSDVEGGWPGVGNIDSDPCFVDDFHLGPDSPCINAGDPNYVAGPNETDMDGEARVMWETVDMGADEFNPIRLGIVSKKRVARTEFVYDCNVAFTNLWKFAIKNVQLEMISAPHNIDINEPNVSFGDIEFSPRESITSIDTCAFEVDRSQAIEPAQIIWRVSCTRADTGMPIELTIGGVGSAGFKGVSSELTAAEKNGFLHLAALSGQWLWTGTAGGIDQDIVQDGSVNLADFAEFAAKWRGTEK